MLRIDNYLGKPGDSGFATRLARGVHSLVQTGAQNIRITQENRQYYGYDNCAYVSGDAYHGRVLSSRVYSYGFDDDRTYTAWLIAVPAAITPETPFGWDFKEISVARGDYDATDEIKEIYRKTLARRKRLLAVRTRRTRQSDVLNTARNAGISVKAAFELKRIYDDSVLFETIFPLLKSYNTLKLRSNFRIAMAEHILNWLRSEDRKYPKPLSPKQLDAISQKFGGYSRW